MPKFRSFVALAACLALPLVGSGCSSTTADGLAPIDVATFNANLLAQVKASCPIIQQLAVPAEIVTGAIGAVTQQPGVAAGLISLEQANAQACANITATVKPAATTTTTPPAATPAATSSEVIRRRKAIAA